MGLLLLVCASCDAPMALGRGSQGRGGRQRALCRVVQPIRLSQLQPFHVNPGFGAPLVVRMVVPDGMELAPKCSSCVFFACPCLLGAKLMALSLWLLSSPAGKPVLQGCRQPLASSKVLGRLPDPQHTLCSYLFHFCGFICVGGMGFAPLAFDRVFK